MLDLEIEDLELISLLLARAGKKGPGEISGKMAEIADAFLRKVGQIPQEHVAREIDSMNVHVAAIYQEMESMDFFMKDLKREMDKLRKELEEEFEELEKAEAEEEETRKFLFPILF